MPKLHQYEITENGSKHTLQLTEEDAKRFPHARKLGDTAKQTSEPTPAPAPQPHHHEPVRNRARRN